MVSSALRPHGILQARTLQRVAFPFSRGSSQPRDWTRVSCIAGGFFTSWATREAPQADIKAWGPSPLAWGCWQNSVPCNSAAGDPTFLPAVSQGHSQQLGTAATSCSLIPQSQGTISALLHISLTLDSDPRSSFKELRASLVVQWLRIHLPVQGTWGQSLVWEEPTCCRATKPMNHTHHRSPDTLEPVLHNKRSPHTSIRK